MPIQTGFFKNHQPTIGYTGNYCAISKLCTWETIKIFLKNETQKFYSGGFSSFGVFVQGFFVGGICPGGFCPRTSSEA